MKKEILRLENINCFVNGNSLLSNLSLNVYEHEAITILGSKNAGKTLLVDYLTGKTTISSGRVYVQDRKIKNPTNLSKKDIRVSHITKETYLIGNLSIATNFYIALKSSARLIYSKTKAQALAQACLNDLNIKLSAEMRVDSLSNCHRHIVAMCIAFFHHSRLIIVDDAMAGYSPQDIADFLEFLETLKKRNLAVILMTHNIEYATLLSDRLVILKNGSNIKVLFHHPFDKNLISKILLDGPVQTLQREHSPKQPNIPFTLSFVSTFGKPFQFESFKGSLLSIFDPSNIICHNLDQLKYGNTNIPICYASAKENYEFHSLDEAIKQRVLLIFEDYFTEGLFSNFTFKDNVEFFSYDRLAVGILGYISRKKERIFLKDSSLYTHNLIEKNKLFGRKKAIYQHEILLERLRMFSPQVLICVKSLSVLDPYLMNVTFSCFQELTKRGTTIFVLNNDHSAFVKYFDKVFIVGNSKIDAILTSEELQNTEVIAQYLITPSSGIV